MMIIVSLMLLNEGMLQETKIITFTIYNTEFRIYNVYISVGEIKVKKCLDNLSEHNRICSAIAWLCSAIEIDLCNN